jgi:hypothetical protein
MNFFDQIATALDFNHAHEAHESDAFREFDEDGACREFARINLAFN